METMRLLESEKVLQLKYSECTQFLEEHGIDTSTWGRGDSKPLMALTQELLSGEAELDVRTDNGRTEVVRSISIVTANVFFEAAKNSTFRLTEEYQEFSDGTVRQRTEIPESISEKMKIDESPDTAVLRGLQEELGLTIALPQTSFIDSQKFERPSRSYPGVRNSLRQFAFNVYLTEAQFDPDGYIEEQLDKKTYFSWERVNDPQDA